MSVINATVSWTVLQPLGTGIRVERKVDGGPAVTIATLGPSATSLVDPGLEAGKTYSYRPVAFNALGDGPSQEASATTPVLPGGTGQVTVVISIS